MTVAAGTASLWGSMRARLTMLAAGVFGLALVAGGTLWVWGVGVRMLDSQKTADLERAALEATFRAGGPMGRMGFPGRRGRRMPPVDPFRDAYVVAISADGSVTSTRDDDDVSEEALDWIRLHVADRDLDAASIALGERIDEWSWELVSCMRERRGGGRFRGRRGDMMGEPGDFPDREGHEECKALRLDGSADVTLVALAQTWPSRILSPHDSERRLQTLVLARFEPDTEPFALLVDSSLATVDVTIAELKYGLWTGGPILLLFVSGVAWFLVGRSLRVVGEVQREAEQIAFGTLDRRIEPPPSDDEISRLVMTLNGMLDRIAAGVARQREFIGDASHELKSPIAATRALLEVALGRSDADWPAVGRAARQEVLRMQTLVDDLMGLAQLDELGSGALAFSEIDLDDILREEAKLLEDTQTSLAAVSPVRIRGHERGLRRLVQNLLANAYRYGHGHIRVELYRRGTDAILVIEDDGPGIEVEDRGRVFDRFTRLDSSRSRDEGGSGLGLALVKGIAEAHGGDIWIEDGSLGGARMVVRLPSEPAIPA